MGRRSKRAPRHGSLAYLPRGRAKGPVGKINYWPDVEVDNPKLLGFAGYKVGMSFVYMTRSRRGSPIYGQEVYSPVTLIEVPSMLICGLRSYINTSSGMKTLTEAWAQKLPRDLERLRTPPKKMDDSALKKIETNLNELVEFRAIVCTQPRKANVPQKKPEMFEVKVAGGDLKDQFEYLKGRLGQEIDVSEIFEEGQYVDIMAVTKGKGIQGAVKRWGVKILQHKSRKTVRGIGTLGAWTPHYVMYSVPRAGQMGFHQRTAMNKRILKISKDTSSFPTAFPHYGVIRDTYIILKGSIPGPVKRLVKLRYAIYPPSKVSEAEPNITYPEI